MIGGVLLRAIAIVISAVFVAGSWLTDGAPNLSFLRFFSAAVLACSVSLFVWNRWIWKLSFFQSIPGVARNVGGTWRATLQSLWVDPANGEVPAPKVVYIVIRQTSARAAITLISDESVSSSTLARVVKEEDQWSLHYMYTNEPTIEVRAVSPMHHGSVVLSIVGKPARRLSGNYWTDRDSKGKLSLIERSAVLAEDFEEASHLFEAVNSSE